ncbi:MAG: C4-type zinc ribbon domain-containing protein [Actinomycetota bacterium]|nr:C4-type zinc ribbon domain-containing protein [Actinomycetota bacterium]
MDQPGILLKIQEIDLEIVREERKLDEMPEKRAILELRKKTREVQILHAKAGQLVGRLERAAAKNGDEISGVDDKISSEQKKIMSGEVTNPKELQNLSRELDALKRRKDKLEMEALALMERQEKATGQIAKVEQALEQLGQREATLVEEFTAKGGEIQTLVARLREERATLMKAIDAELYRRYEVLKEAKSGIGVGLLVGASCTACHMELPAERLEELHAGPEVAICPACRRLLVVRGEESTE